MAQAKLYRYRGCIVRVRTTEAVKTVGGVAPELTGRKRKAKPRIVVELCAPGAAIPIKKATDRDFEAAKNPLSSSYAPLPSNRRP